MCVLALLCALGCLVPAAAAAADLIVQRDPGLSAARRADLRADAGVRHERTLALPDAEVVSVPAAEEQEALAALNADPDVTLAAVDVPVHAAAAPEVSWPLDWPESDPLKRDADVDALAAWGTGNEGDGVIVGVVDESIDADHPDLAGQVQPEADFVTDTACRAAEPTGGADHGTYVAGLIAALHDGKGMSGLAPAATVKPLRALDNCGGGTLSDVLDAFDYAGLHHIPIVSASFATDPLLPAAARASTDELIGRALDRWPNTLYVVAAGNEGNDDDALPVYPCSDDADNLVCVGMSDQNDAPACWGNVGRQSVDVFAPGDRVYSTVRGAGTPTYAMASGTSVAAPLVAAAAALILSQPDRQFSVHDLEGELQRGVDQFPGLTDISVFGGRLNAARSLYQRAPGLGYGGAGGTWTTCDPDHDGVHGSADRCPTLPGSIDGCPDADGDGVTEDTDNCPAVANPGQENADGDDLGDVCDATPHGVDSDGDTKADTEDRCPTQPADTPDGCPVVLPPPPPPPADGGTAANPAAVATPTPVAAPRVISLAVKVNRCPAHHTCKQAAKVTVLVSRAATVAFKVEKRARSHGRWTWKRVTARSLSASVSRSLTVRGRRGHTLARGRYRVTATIAGAGKARTFKV